MSSARLMVSFAGYEEPVDWGVGMWYVCAMACVCAFVCVCVCARACVCVFVF